MPLTTFFSSKSQTCMTCLMGAGAGSAAALLVAFVLVVQGQVAQAEVRRQTETLASRAPVAQPPMLVVNALQQPRHASLQRAQSLDKTQAPRLMTVAFRSGGEQAGAGQTR